MMVMQETRRRGVMLRLLDMEKVHALLLPFAEENAPGMTTFEVGFQPWAFGVAPDGKAYVVCNEGVGWEVDESEHTVVFEVFGSRLLPDGKRQIAMGPSAAVAMYRPEVEAVLTDQEIDLADLIRAFGQRLESNFALWHDRLTRKAASA